MQRLFVRRVSGSSLPYLAAAETRTGLPPNSWTCHVSSLQLVRAQSNSSSSKPRFHFRTAHALFAKQAARPFPPPFLSRPSGSFSDPLSTYNESRFRQVSYRGQLLRGLTNGEDAVLLGPQYIGVNDGVGGWSDKKNGHPA